MSPTGQAHPSGEAGHVERAALAIADAIARKDVAALAGFLAPRFIYRQGGEEPRDAGRFLDAIGQIPGEILFVRLEKMTIDVAGDGAVVAGVQHAQVRVDGKRVDDKRSFVDWFVRVDGEWRIRLAIDLPAP